MLISIVGEGHAELLDTRRPAIVRIENGALDESDIRGGSIVLRGRIAPDTLRFLKVDSDYQRPLENRRDIFEAIKSAKVLPDIDVGVRGQDFVTDGDDYLIRSPAFVIDGAQRVGTALAILDQNPDAYVAIGALIHFGTDKAWEAQRFCDLNTNIRKVSPSLHLRNERERSPAILTLYGLSHTKGLPLYERVCWSQNMRRGELISALVLAKTSRFLHSHRTSLTGPRADQITASLDIACSNISLNTFRQNVMTFFNVVEECWGISAIEYRAAAPQVKGAFLMMLARVFSQHLDFWRGDELHVDYTLRRKLKTFSLVDPNVRQLAGSGGSATNLLFQLLVEHINSGKRERRLRSRFA